MQPGRISLLTSCSFTGVSTPFQLKIFKGKFLLQGCSPSPPSLQQLFGPNALFLPAPGSALGSGGG